MQSQHKPTNSPNIADLTYLLMLEQMGKTKDELLKDQETKQQLKKLQADDKLKEQKAQSNLQWQQKPTHSKNEPKIPNPTSPHSGFTRK